MLGFGLQLIGRTIRTHHCWQRKPSEGLRDVADEGGKDLALFLIIELSLIEVALRL